MAFNRMLHVHPLDVAPPAQLVLVDRWDQWSSGSAVADCWGDPNPAERGLIAALARQVLWGRVAELLTGDRCGLVDAAEVALAEIAAVYAGNAATAKKVIGEVRRFVTYVSACGVEYVDELTAGLVEGFVWSASRRYGAYSEVSATTAANRQSFLRRFFQTLTEMGLWSGGDVVGAAIRRDTGETSRPLTADELHLVHVYADSGLFTTQRALLVVFAEAGADATETAQICVDDLDLDQGTVRLTGPMGRVNPLTPWGLATLRSVLEVNPARSGEPLCVTAGLPVERAAQSITVRLREVLVDAGLAGRPRVTARSIRLTIARQVLDTAGVEEAARFLGNASLDATAAALDHHWWDH